MGSLAVYGGVIYHTLRIAVPTVAEAATGSLTTEACDRRIASWSEALVRGAKIEMEVEGAEHASCAETFVVMSNHQSQYDIPVLFQAFARPLRMVAKAELFRIPIFSGAMRAAQFVKVDRANHESAVRSLKAARHVMDQGVSIWIAPEGTRSETGQLGPFRKGGFHLALDTGARILPATVVGTRDALRARGRRIHQGAHVRVHFSPPVDPTAYGVSRLDELVEAVREAIAGHLPPGLGD